MNDSLMQPVVFNIITIVALLFSLFQVVIGESARLTRSAEAILLLEELVDRAMRKRLANYLKVTMVIAILANVVANYLGRGRHFTNTARIRELEAELRTLREG